MSFNPKGSMPSSREAEVLERQRLMANRMAASNKTNDKPSSQTRPSSVTTKGVGTSERPILIGGEITAEMALEHARRQVAAKCNQQPSMSYDDKKKPSTNKTTPQPASSSKLKRPTMRRTASSLAKASNRTNNVTSGEETSKPSAILESTSSSSSGTAAAAGSLSSLLLSNADTAKYLKPNAPKLLQHYDKIEPDQ